MSRLDPLDTYELKDFRYSSHYWILKTLALESKPLRILDVGTAGGYLGRLLRQRGHYVAGIESDATRAQEAKYFYDSFRLADVEQFDFPYRGEFDYILFADVLEHLRDPAAVLRACLPALKDSGRIVLSVPNVANLLIRLSLLSGRFDYADRGILDRTHLRFYTLRTLRQMLNVANCEPLDIVPTPLPVQIVLPFTRKKFFAPAHQAHYGLTRLWKAGLAYQFVVTAAPISVPAPHEEEIPVERILTHA